MVQFEHSVSGGQISRALASDPEEAAIFFKDLITDAPDDFPAEVAEHLDDTERQEVAAFLNLLAERIGAAT
jgi:hypothetical protein